MMKKRGIVTAILAAAALAVTGCAETAGQTKESAAAITTLAASSAQAQVSGNTVTVTAKGSVKETPDMAAISLGITTNESTAEKAQKKNTESVNKVKEKLKDLGVEEKSLQTSGYDIYPQYDYNSNKITSYQVTTTLTVSDRKIADTGKLITEAVAAGANNVNNVTYTCSSYDEKYQEALQAAVSAAQAKAQVLAEAAGKTLGEPSVLVEGYQDTSAQYDPTVSGKTMAMESMNSADSMQMEPGQMSIDADVTVTYSMQ